MPPTSPLTAAEIAELRRKVEALKAATNPSPWKFNPKHEMFMGTTNALEMYEDTLDLGRDCKEWIPVDDGNTKGYRLSDGSVKRAARIKAIGEFLETCREDTTRLLDAAERLDAAVAAERERCAKIAEGTWTGPWPDDPSSEGMLSDADHGYASACRDIATEIRKGGRG